MSDAVEVKVPDIGDFEAVDVVEVLVSEGDEVAEEDSLITLESDKATMDVPAPRAGKVAELKVSAGDQVAQGDVILLLEEAGDGEEDEAEPEDGEAEGAEEETGGDGEREEDGEERGEEDRGEDEGEAERKKKDRGAPAEEDEKNGEDGKDEEEAGKARKGAKEEKAAKDGRGEERSGAATVSGGEGELPDDASGADVVCDVLVLGSGPGGYTAAFRAADLGQETVLVERHSTLGGVCLNVGCIPSKALLHAAKVIDEVAEFADRGLVFGEPRIDLERLRGWKDSVVERLTGGLAQLARRREVTVVRGTGRLVSPHRLEVEGEEGTTTVGFRRAILAAGSRPIEIPGLPWDDERVMDSAGALELPEVPPRLLVVGGGIIGLEMACVYRALGSEVTVVELTDGLMPGTDRDLVRPLHKRLDLQGVRILLATRVTGAEAGAEEIRVELEGDHSPSHASFDRVLVAVGRRPNGDRIGAEAAGVEVDERGFVPVDRRQRTNVPHIFAIGDLVGQPLLAHKASHEGKVAAEVAAGGKSAFDARVVPSVAYTDPEVAWVGWTETEAKAEGISYGKGHFPWAASGRSLGMGREEGMTKLLFDEETGRLLGGGIVGPSAGDLVSEIALAIEMGADAADLGLTIHPHPTLSETVAFAAEAFEGTLTELYRPKKEGKKGSGGKKRSVK